MKNIAYLGPRGTFTEAALLQLKTAKDAHLIPFETVTAVLDAVRSGEVDALYFTAAQCAALAV